MGGLALVNCSLVDLEGSGSVRRGATILVKDACAGGAPAGVIEAVAPAGGIAAPAGYRVVDLAGSYVLPGLVDAHVHLFGSGAPMRAMAGGAARARMVHLLRTGLGKSILRSMVRAHAQAALNAGTTTLRCLGDIQCTDVELRDAIDLGRLPGPRLLVSGPALCVTGGHGSGGFSIECDSPWEARKGVRANVRECVDIVKICVTGGVTDARKVGEAGRLQMTVEEVGAVCDEAHKVGLMVAAHVESTEGVRVALRGGVDTIEHGAALDDELVDLFKRNPKSLRGYSSLVVTLYPALVLAELDSSVTLLNPVARENSARVLEGMILGAKRARAEGLSIGLGTDASCPFVPPYGTWRELVFETELLGLSPAEALRAATIGNARILGIDGVAGSLEVGKSADLIAVAENPLADLRSLSRVGTVVARGRLIERPRVKRSAAIEAALEALDRSRREKPA